MGKEKEAGTRRSRGSCDMYTFARWDPELTMAMGTSSQCVRQTHRDGVHLERDSVSPEGITGLGGMAKSLVHNSK